MLQQEYPLSNIQDVFTMHDTIFFRRLEALSNFVVINEQAEHKK